MDITWHKIVCVMFAIQWFYIGVKSKTSNKTLPEKVGIFIVFCSSVFLLFSNEIMPLLFE